MLMHYLFNPQNQFFIQTIYTEAIRIYPSEDFLNQTMDLLILILNIMKNIDRIQTLSRHKEKISQELTNHFLIIQKQIVDESGANMHSKNILLYELLLWHMKVEPSLAKYLNTKTWERLLYLFFHSKSKNILLSYIYQIIVIWFRQKSEKLLVNIFWVHNMLAPMAKLYEDRQSFELYHLPFSQHILYIYVVSIFKILQAIEEWRDPNYKQIASQLKFSSNFKKIKLLDLELYPVNTLDNIDNLSLNPRDLISQDMIGFHSKESSKDSNDPSPHLKELKKVKISKQKSEAFHPSELDSPLKLPKSKKDYKNANEISFSASDVHYHGEESHKHIPDLVHSEIHSISDD